MINFFKKLFTNTEHGIPYSTGNLGWQNSCVECNREQYLHNYGYAQFCKEHAPTIIMNCSPEEYERKYGISVNQIKSENANINIKFNL